VGNTFGDKAAFAQLIDEVETKVFDRLPDDTWFYPGTATTPRSAPSAPPRGVARPGVVRSAGTDPKVHRGWSTERSTHT
jgi:hypothetical protein